jgi:hypothetical protein
MTDTAFSDMRKQFEQSGIEPDVAARFTAAQMAVIERQVEEMEIKMTLAVSLKAISGLRWQTEQWIAGASGTKTPEETETASAWYEDHYASLEQAWQAWADDQLAKIADRYAGASAQEESI